MLRGAPGRLGRVNRLVGWVGNRHGPPTAHSPGSPRARPGSAAAGTHAGAESAAAGPHPAVDLTLKPVSETPTEASDYAAISFAFGALLAALAASGRSREPIARADLLPLSAATFSLSRLIVHDKAETWLREPFVAEEGDRKRPKGRRLRYAIGELMTCTRCMGAWSALALVGLRLHAPRAGRTVTTVLAASAGNDALQAGFSWLCARANEQSATTDTSTRLASAARRAA